MKEDEMDRSCGMYGGEILNSVLVEKPEEMRPLGKHQDVGLRIILKWFLNT
jgi:hypothetical protein